MAKELAETKQMNAIADINAGDDDQHQFLTFTLGDEIFGIGILVIKEIIEFTEVTRVPMVPDYIRGVINVRGSVVPVIDLSRRLGREVSDPGKRTCVVIVEVESDGEVLDIGVMVDAVNEVLEIPPSEVEAAPSFGAKIRTDFIKGMGKVNEKFVVLLSIENVLSVEELSMLGEMSDSASLAADSTEE